MRVLTYVNGVVTVINGDIFFNGAYEKPSFIIGDSFYYEPTMKTTQGRELTALEVSQAELYIDTFVIPTVEPISPKLVHCVDGSGNYVGFKEIAPNEIEVSSAPAEIVQGYTWDFEKQVWYKSILIDSRSGKLIGTGSNLNIDHTMYIPSDLVDTALCFESQIYNFETKKVEIDLSIVRTKKLQRLSQEFAQDVIAFIGYAPTSEIASWKLQEDEARAWVANNNAETPLIDALLIGRNMEETKASLIAKIVAKADAYKVFYGQILGRLHAKQKLIEVATTLEELKAIGW